MYQLTGLLTRIVGAAFIATMVIMESAEAAQFNFSFSGRGTTGNIIFDDSILDTNPNPVVGEYLGAIIHFHIHINGTPQSETAIPTFEIIQGSSGSVIVGLPGNGIGSCGPVDCLTFLLGSNIFPPIDPSNFDLSFEYPAGSLLSDALPTAVPATGEALLRSTPRQFSLGGDALSSISPVSIPEPEIWSMLGIGAAVLALRKRRKNGDGMWSRAASSTCAVECLPIGV